VTTYWRNPERRQAMASELWAPGARWSAHIAGCGGSEWTGWSRRAGPARWLPADDLASGNDATGPWCGAQGPPTVTGF
jgi:hypothetical protein